MLRRHKPLLLSTWLGVLFLVQFDQTTDLCWSYTLSYPSCPFLSTLGKLSALMDVYSKDLLTDNILLYCRPLITQHRTTTTHMAGRDQTRRLPVLPWQHYDIRVTLYSILLWNVIVDSKVLINFSLLKFQSLHRERVDLTYSEKSRDSILHIYSTHVYCVYMGYTIFRYAISFCAQNGVREFSNTSEIHCTTFSHIVKL